MTGNVKLEDIGKKLAEEYPITGDRLFAQIIPTSLDTLLVAIDQCRHFMSHSTSAFTSSTGRRGHLSAEREKELDETLELYYKDVNGKAEREIERLGNH